MRRKLKDTGGFTLVEMLCAVAILVMLCLLMSTGISMAVKSYRDITAESETELLVSTITDALADKLRYCMVTEKTKTDEVFGTETKELKIFITEESDIGGSGSTVMDVKTVRIEGGKLVVDTVTAPDGTTTGKQLLPDGAYGATGQFSAGYIGKYTVEQVKGDDGNPVPLVIYNPEDNSFRIQFIVECEKAGVTQTADVTVRCLNPVRKEVE